MNLLCARNSTVLALHCHACVEYQWLWYSNNGIMMKPARPPVSLWKTLTRNKITTWSGLRWPSGFCFFMDCAASLVAYQDRVVKEWRKSLFMVILPWSSTMKSRYCQHLLEGKTRQSLIGPRLELGHSMNAVQADSSIVIRVHAPLRTRRRNVALDANMQTEREREWRIRGMLFKVSQWRCMLPGSTIWQWWQLTSAKLDFNLMILRGNWSSCVVVKCWGWLSKLFCNPS